jgi:hypothetical protein
MERTMDEPNRMISALDLHTARVGYLSSMAHEHTWQPVEGVRGRYICDCAEQGFRNLLTGKIALSNTRVHLDPRDEANRVHPRSTVQLGNGCGQVARIDPDML